MWATPSGGSGNCSTHTNHPVATTSSGSSGSRRGTLRGTSPASAATPPSEDSKKRGGESGSRSPEPRLQLNNVMVDPIFDFQFRIILIGDSAVGKSSLLRKFTFGSFAEVSTTELKVRIRHGTDPGQVTGTGHRKGCPVPGDLGSGTKWVQWVLAKDKFDS